MAAAALALDAGGWVWRYQGLGSMTRRVVTTRHLLPAGDWALRPWCGRPRVSSPEQWRGAEPREAAVLDTLAACRRCLTMATRHLPALADQMMGEEAKASVALDGGTKYLKQSLEPADGAIGVLNAPLKPHCGRSPPPSTWPSAAADGP